jgi:hypothetical protein
MLVIELASIDLIAGNTNYLVLVLVHFLGILIGKQACDDIWLRNHSIRISK